MVVMVASMNFRALLLIFYAVAMLCKNSTSCVSFEVVFEGLKRMKHHQFRRPLKLTFENGRCRALGVKKHHFCPWFSLLRSMSIALA